ncbi:START domain-containing protein [Thiolapillus sp.]
MKPLISLILAFLLSPALAGNWKLEKDEEGIRVYTRDYPASDIREFRAEMRLPVSLDRVLAVFDDFKRYPEWKFKVSKAGVLDQPDARSWHHYQDINMPFPLDDRLFVLHSRLRPVSEQEVVIETRAVPGWCKAHDVKTCEPVNASDALLVQKASGKHVLRQLDDGSTHVTWIQHAEPGGVLPDWLVNSMLVDGPWETFNKLREQVNKPRYRQARLRRDAAGNLLGGFENVSW